eukprot:2813853-Karenia_brevis.AAC.1
MMDQTNNYQNCSSQCIWAADGATQSPVSKTGTPIPSVATGHETDEGIQGVTSFNQPRTQMQPKHMTPDTGTGMGP